MKGRFLQSIGFLVEVLLFVFTGILITINIFHAFVVFVCAVLVALLVGKQIVYNTIAKYKEENR